MTISGVGNVQALEGAFIIVHCAYNINGNLIKSNAVMYKYMSLMEYYFCPHEHAQVVYVCSHLQIV